MRIGVTGLAGRMGLLLAAEVVAAGHTLAGGTLRPGGRQAPPDQAVFTDISALAAACDAVIDFTHADAVQAHAAALGAAGVAALLLAGLAWRSAVIRSVRSLPSAAGDDGR